MIQIGKQSSEKYWGKFKILDYVMLNSPVRCFSAEKGDVDFNPAIVKILWDKEPSGDKNDLWFPYWITVDGREKYGQFAPMIGENALLELFLKAIDHGFFGKRFLESLEGKIRLYLEKRPSGH